jgi:hypothetical protein
MNRPVPLRPAWPGRVNQGTVRRVRVNAEGAGGIANFSFVGNRCAPGWAYGGGAVPALPVMLLGLGWMKLGVRNASRPRRDG